MQALHKILRCERIGRLCNLQVFISHELCAASFAQEAVSWVRLGLCALQQGVRTQKGSTSNAID
jgi:hypothetical protein